MGYSDRSYSRDPNGGWNPLMWLLTGSVPLFTVAGIHVRAHASLIVLAVLVVLFGLGPGFTAQDRVLFITTLFTVILLHEFGHCFGARIMGGSANEILMTPLGGLAYAMSPRRPLATFVTVAAGPLVNVVLMLIAASAMYALGGKPSWNPWGFATGPAVAEWSNAYWYIAWFFQLNYLLLLFNLLPIFPLDGGQLLQSILWKPMGYYKSMMFALNVGLVGSVAMAMFALAGGGVLLFFIAVSCFFTCYPFRQQLKAAGPYAFAEQEEDYSASLAWRPESESPSSAREDARALRKQQAAAAAQAEQAKIDAILQKVSEKGMHSLNFFEKRTLKQATERQRQRTLKQRR